VPPIDTAVVTALSELSETDLALLEALQVQPRAPWSRIGPVIGIDASTAARRWRRLTEQGMAWMSAYPAQHVSVIGYVDVACRADALDAVTRRVESWGPVFGVERTTGDHPLFLSVAAHDLPSLDDFVTRCVGGLDGVRSMRLSICTRVYKEGSGWLVHALSEQQRATLSSARTRTVRAPGPAGPYESDLPLLAALGADGRGTHAELARASGLSETTVRRRLHRMTGNGELYFRCDLNQYLAGWPVSASYRIAAPGAGADSVARALAALPQTRLCCSVTGASNLLLSVWLRSAADCPDLEARILRRHPDLRITDRTITLHAPKRMGRLIDRQGMARAYVPLTAAPRDVRGHSQAASSC
jgi:DNA-binding Lrp family transcriptional regulator